MLCEVGYEIERLSLGMLLTATNLTAIKIIASGFLFIGTPY